jgi:hypothetical protein
MSRRYLVRWSPYQILRVLHDDEICEVPNGCDIINEPLDSCQKYIDKWQGKINWDKVLDFHAKGDYKEIFIMHNNGNWTDDVYCCDRYKANVDYNVGLFKNS